MNKIKLFVIIFFFGLVSALAQNKPYTKYKLVEGETIRSVCKKLSITPYKLLQLNPEIKDNDKLEGVTILIVPNKDYSPVSASGEHVDYVKDGFLYHKLLPKETYSKLKREYGVVKKVLRRHNSDLRFGGLKAGKIIKIPVGSNFSLPQSSGNVVDTKKTKPYLVKPKETKYSISKRYGISIKKLEELNPSIKTEGLKLETVIMVPNTKEIPNDNAEFVIHKAEKSEGLYRISKNYGVTQEQLLANNPELKNGVKEGMLIKIPLSESKAITSTQVFTPSIKQGKELNVVFMLPFMSKKAANINFEKNKTADIATDFYMGALMALDSLKKEGLSINVKTFDTENSKATISSVFTTLDLSKVDVIIGPMFYGNLELVAKLTKGRNIPIISPVSKRNHAAIGHSSLIQEIPSVEQLSTALLNYIESSYKDQNLVVIADDKASSKTKIAAIVSKLESLDSINKVTVLKPKKGYIKRNLFLEKIVKNKDNYVVLVTTDTIVTKDVINNLGTMPKERKITFFALNKGGNFDAHDDINNQLAYVNFHFPEYNFIDYENEKVKFFVSSYNLKNFADPTEFSFKGFDITYDTLLRLGSFEDMNNALNAGSSQRMSTKFNYKKNAVNKGFINQGVYIIKYDELNLVKVE